MVTVMLNQSHVCMAPDFSTDQATEYDDRDFKKESCS